MDLCVFPLYLFKADNHRQELHPVVGGEAESAGDFLLEGAAAEHYPVASGTRVPAGRAVRKKVYGRL